MTSATSRPDADRDEHRAFLNKYYGLSRGVYDLTRRYFLLGREAMLKHLARDRWSSLVEVGPGTGRNLAKLKALRPEAELGGIEASDAMLEHAAKKVPWAKMVHGFAEDADIEAIFGKAPDRILFAYCLSMVQEPLKALEHCRRALPPHGEVIVVDFGDLAGLPTLPRKALRAFLDSFHVYELPDAELSKQCLSETHGRGRYWSMYRFGPLSD